MVLVSTFVASTCAPTNTPPNESVTRPVMVAVGLAKTKPFHPSKKASSLVSLQTTQVRLNWSSKEYAVEKGILYQRQERILTSGIKQPSQSHHYPGGQPCARGLADRSSKLDPPRQIPRGGFKAS